MEGAGRGAWVVICCGGVRACDAVAFPVGLGVSLAEAVTEAAAAAVPEEVFDGACCW